MIDITVVPLTCSEDDEPLVLIGTDGRNIYCQCTHCGQIVSFGLEVLMMITPKGGGNGGCS